MCGALPNTKDENMSMIDGDRDGRVFFSSSVRKVRWSWNHVPQQILAKLIDEPFTSAVK